MKYNVLHTITFYALILALAVGLKYHYSRASSEDLEWIFRPTANLVELVSGLDFIQETGTGYVNTDHRIIIAPACAGVNFLIAAFCMAGFSFLHRFRTPQEKFLWFCGSLVSAYLLTLFVNTLRITLAIHFYHTEFSPGWLTPDRIHRLQGIVVYFSFLCVYYLGLQKCAHYQPFRKFTGYIPAFWYGLVLLVVPLLNAAYRGNENRFLEHCGFIAAGCVAVLIVIGLIQRGWAMRNNHESLPQK